MAATISTTEAPIPRRGPFSFSLGGLLLTTTCLAVALAIANWSLWDTDERWILRLWFAGAIAPGVLDRMRGKRGILAAALGGGLAPALMTLQMWQNPSRFALDPKSWIGELGHNSVLLAFFAGALAAGLLAALCWFGPRMPKRTALGLASLVVLSLAAWWGFEATRWRPRLIIGPETTRAGRGISPNPVLSSDGRMLAVTEYPYSRNNERMLELWSIAGRAANPIGMTQTDNAIVRMEFSPDDRTLVLVPQVPWPSLREKSPILPVLWFDLTTGLRYRPAQSTYPWALDDIRFSSDGKTLTAIGQNEAGTYCQLTIDAATRELTSVAVLDRRSMIAVLPLGTTVVERELIVDLETQHVRLREAKAVASAGGGNWIVATRTDESPKPWTARLPFHRHLYSREVRRSQLVLIVPATGQIARASPWYRTLGSIAVSRDGRVLATTGNNGQIQIWDVP